jgi:hypothetical protein
MLKQLLFIFIVFPMVVFAQNDTLIKGKVVSESTNLEGIHVFNTTQKRGEITDARGYFSINVRLNDTLQLSAVHLTARQYVIKKNDLKAELVFIEMKSLISVLDEITLTEYKSINAVSLGIIPANQKSYTPAERKVRTATTGLIDPLLNWASGRTSMLKSQVGIERKEQLQAKTTDYFERKYFVETLNIPEEYVDGFLFYIVENERYTKAMKDKNKTMATFILSELAVEYLKLKEIVTEKPVLNEK